MSIYMQIAATERVTVLFRSACKSLILGDSGGLNRTIPQELPTGSGTVASIYNHETKIRRLIISVALAHLQIKAIGSRCVHAPVTVLFRRKFNSRGEA